MLASTSRTKLRYIIESLYGVTPGTSDPTALRFTGESLDFTIATDTSKEIRDDRMEDDLIIVGASAQGGYNFEMSYLEYDPFLEAVLQGTWAKYGTAGVGTTFTATFTATTITATIAPTGTSAFTNLVKGQWFKLTAPTHANDGKYYQVSNSVSPTSTVITVSAASALAVGTAVALCAVSAARLVNGTTQRSITIEKEFADVAQFFTYRGMNAAKLGLSFQSGSIVTGNFDFLGKDSVRAGTSGIPVTTAEVASQDYAVMNAVSGIGQIMEGGSALSGTFIKTLSFAHDNKMRGRDGLGVLGNADVGSGTIDFKGTMVVYLADGTLYDKFLNNTASSLSLRSVDAAGNGYIYTLPKIKYEDAKVTAGGKDQDAVISLPFKALKDSVTGSAIIIDRVGVAG